MKPVHDMGVAELAAALKTRALSSREATQALLDRITPTADAAAVLATARKLIESAS